MKYNILILLMGVMYSTVARVQGQDNYSAMLLKLNGEGIVIRNANEHVLTFPKQLYSDDIVKLNSGSAIIMLYSGKEIELSAVSDYTIPNETVDNETELHNMANAGDGQSLLSQSGMAYQIRGKGDVFPRNSKLINTENCTLRLMNPNKDAYELKVINSFTQKIVYQIDNITDSTIALVEVPFVKGQSYYWTLTNKLNGQARMGTIVMSEEVHKVKKDYTTHFDRLNRISFYNNNKYYFEAYALLQESVDKYPDYPLYKILLNNLLSK